MDGGNSIQCKFYNPSESSRCLNFLNGDTTNTPLRLKSLMVCWLSKWTKQNNVCDNPYFTMQSSPFQAIMITSCHIKWPGIVENTTGKRKKSHTFDLPNPGPCIHKEVKPSQSGLKWSKFLFHLMHWADKISNGAYKCLPVWETISPVVPILRENTLMSSVHIIRNQIDLVQEENT